jgi:CHAD domain-containing protein
MGQRAELAPGDQFCAAMSKLIAARYETLWKTMPAAIAGDDIEGVHDVRVASRRLRAAMDVAVECFPSEWYRPLHKNAKEITSSLGAVRDLDVQIEALSFQRLNSPPEEWPGIDFLLTKMEAERDEARENMLAFLTKVDNEGIADEAEIRFGKTAGAGEVAS